MISLDRFILKILVCKATRTLNHLITDQTNKADNLQLLLVKVIRHLMYFVNTRRIRHLVSGHLKILILGLRKEFRAQIPILMPTILGEAKALLPKRTKLIPQEIKISEVLHLHTVSHMTINCLLSIDMQPLIFKQYSLTLGSAKNSTLQGSAIKNKAIVILITSKEKNQLYLSVRRDNISGHLTPSGLVAPL